MRIDANRVAVAYQTGMKRCYMFRAARIELQHHLRRAYRDVKPVSVVGDRAHVDSHIADHLEELTQFAGTVAQVDGEAEQAPHFNEAVANYPIEQIDVDIASGTQITTCLPLSLDLILSAPAKAAAPAHSASSFSRSRINRTASLISKSSTVTTSLT